MADALSRPFATAGRAFEQANPAVKLDQIPSGSVLAARKLTDANDRADVLAVADYSVIETLLRPNHADWSICFATNEIGIAYTDASAGAAELTADNWIEVLTRDGVKVAAANPFHDPCGYWTELCWQLADLHYPAEQGGGTIARRMRARCGQPDSRRSDSQELLQLVEAAGGIDYAFVYRSQAMQHNLPFLRLPGEINLGDLRSVDLYRRVEIELPGKPGEEPFRKRGDVIVFALTIPRSAEHPDWAARYIAFLLSPEGRSLLTREHLVMLDEPWTYDLEQVPASLRPHLATFRQPDDPATAPEDAHAE